MNYTKPEVTVSRRAAVLIQGHPKEGSPADNMDQTTFVTTNAYEADE